MKMFENIFDRITNLFKVNPYAGKKGYQWYSWYISATAIQKKEQLKLFDKDLYNWTLKAEPFVSSNQIDEIVDTAVFNWVYKLLIPEMANAIKEHQVNNDPDLILVEIEKQKLKELQEMSWRQALVKR